MSSLSTMEAELPPGFRFQPTDDELICDYLMKRLEDPCLMIDIVDLNKCEPWDIPETACVGGKQWYFYSQRDRKYATGIRTNRATVSGYWKATGKDKMVVNKGSQLIGMRKTLVFHKGRAPMGNKTGWVMHQFRLHNPLALIPKLPSSSKDQDWVMCRVFNKSKEKGPSKHSISQATSSHSYNVKTGSSFLPALTYSYTNHHVYDDQVSCFSNSSYIPHFFNTEEPKSTSLITAPSVGNSSFSAGDENVVDAVLSQLTKMEEDMDSAYIWSNHYY